jgi:hypothetical protein
VKTFFPKLISWPDKQQYGDIVNRFSQRQGFPRVIGTIDGTYIPITGPSEFRDLYICCTRFYCNFTFRVYATAVLNFWMCTPHTLDQFMSQKCSGSSLHDHLQKDCPQAFHLLGDSASILLVPFTDNGHLISEQKKFNFAHSSTRVDIVRCFGLLKGKFHKLKFFGCD